MARFFFRKSSNINIINFCQQKDEAIDHKYTVTEEAREMYQQFLNENLSREKKMREKKLSDKINLLFWCFFLEEEKVLIILPFSIDIKNQKLLQRQGDSSISSHSTQIWHRGWGRANTWAWRASQCTGTSEKGVCYLDRNDMRASNQIVCSNYDEPVPSYSWFFFDIDTPNACSRRKKPKEGRWSRPWWSSWWTDQQKFCKSIKPRKWFSNDRDIFCFQILAQYGS